VLYMVIEHFRDGDPVPVYQGVLSNMLARHADRQFEFRLRRRDLAAAANSLTDREMPEESHPIRYCLHVLHPPPESPTRPQLSLMRKTKRRESGLSRSPPSSNHPLGLSESRRSCGRSS